MIKLGGMHGRAPTWKPNRPSASRLQPKPVERAGIRLIEGDAPSFGLSLRQHILAIQPTSSSYFDLFILETARLPLASRTYDRARSMKLLTIYFILYRLNAPQLPGIAALKEPRENANARGHKSRETRVNCIVPFCSTVLMKLATRLAYYSTGVTRDHLFAGYTGLKPPRRSSIPATYYNSAGTRAWSPRADTQTPNVSSLLMKL